MINPSTFLLDKGDKLRFLNESLLEEEKLIHFTRPHWIIFAPGVIAFLAAVAFWNYAAVWFSSDLQIYGYSLHQIVTVVLLAFGIFSILKAIVFYRTSEYGITDKRVLMKTGWIQRNSLEIFLNKIEAIHVDQSILGRILNYGCLIIIGTGGTKDHFYSAPKPLHFRKIVQQQIDIFNKREMTDVIRED